MRPHQPPPRPPPPSGQLLAQPPPGVGDAAVERHRPLPVPQLGRLHWCAGKPSFLPRRSSHSELHRRPAHPSSPFHRLPGIHSAPVHRRHCHPPQIRVLRRPGRAHQGGSAASAAVPLSAVTTLYSTAQPSTYPRPWRWTMALSASTINLSFSKRCLVRSSRPRRGLPAGDRRDPTCHFHFLTPPPPFRH